ncbi:hypothetical protein N7490_005720 [Penicillium lividum]|nr:hypothetical protein N7490_005720 [Penicillium lividum]
MTDRVRRNGQLSSCEPCRKSKLRCDHNRPICGRCARRRLSQQQCHYHPAPMAKHSMPQSDTGMLQQQHVPRFIAASSSPQTEDSRPYEPINMNRNLMCFADPNTPHSNRIYTSLTRTGIALPRPSLANPQKVSEGAELLNDILELVSEIGDPLECLSFLDAELCVHGPLIELAWTATNNSIRNLLKDRSNINLESISQAIFERTSSPPVFPPTASSGALEAALSTEALRWETIGIYCAQIGVYLGGEKDKSFSLAAHETWKSDRKTLMQRSFRACIQCEAFCDHLGAINDLTLWFLLPTILFATWCFGDDSYHVLRLVGSMSSVFLALGFHRGIHDASLPFYLVEIRKRAIAWAHDHDKVLASFTSRPARLSRHFCVIEMPLDLADSVLMGTDEALFKARENLDADGWNKDKAILPVSGHRAQLMLCMIREEALELKLGPAALDLETKADVRCILRNLKSTWQSIPSHLKYDTTKQWTGQTKNGMMLLALRLEYLYTEFLLYTLLACYCETSRERLIITAHEIVSIVLSPTRRRDLLHICRAEMEWTVSGDIPREINSTFSYLPTSQLVFYAMPCASVLVLELLRQNQHPTEQLSINRSGIIQDISILISCCDSLTESGQSNYQICKQAQSIFSKSLDSILNQTTPNQRDIEELTVHHEQTGYISPGDSNVAQDPEWMAWLDSLGLQGDPWLESIIPTLEFP